MSDRQRFIRKIVYACIIAALLLPLSWLSEPATTESDGGLLAQMRAEHRLSQSTLGDIDPASETIKLAMLGMRGVAVNVLWTKVNDDRKRENWVGLSATLEQIAKLQPNFISVWVYQGWNLSYNISVEFDDYRDRYYWVIRGIDYLREGTQYNRKEPRLTSDIGWTIAQKIGRADEHRQYRRLFREDDDFHGPRPRSQRDNWLVGREYLLEAERWVDQEGLPIKGKNPVLFHSHPVMCLINYAEALEEEGTFGEVAKSAWNRAAESWEQFSNRDMPTQYSFFVRLGDKELFDERAKESLEELNRLAPPDLLEQMLEERIAALDDEQREAYYLPPEERDSRQNEMMLGINSLLSISHMQFADRVTGENRAAALKAAEEATQAEFMSSTIDLARDNVNYTYWHKRCALEPQDATLEARKKMYDAAQAFTAARLLESRELYEDGLKKWRKVLDANTFLLEDVNLVEELSYSIGDYVELLHQLDEPMPDPFILQDVLVSCERYTGRAYPGAPANYAIPLEDEPATDSAAQPDDEPGSDADETAPPEESSDASETPSPEPVDDNDQGGTKSSGEDDAAPPTDEPADDAPDTSEDPSPAPSESTLEKSAPDAP